MKTRHLSPRTGTIGAALAALALSVVFVAGTATAATTVWTGSSTGGEYTTGTNWSTGAAPGASDLAIFNQSTDVNGTITFANSVTVSSFQHRSDTGLITYDIGALQSFTFNGTSIVGSADDTAQIAFINGTINANGLLIINSSSTNSNNNKVTVTGADTAFVGSDKGIRVGGRGGTGNEMVVSDGATVSDTGDIFVGLQGASDSKLTITGTGSSFTGDGAVQIGGSNTEQAGGGTNNRLEVLAGANFSGGIMLLGVGSTFSATDNHLLVSGTGSAAALTNDNTQEFILEIGRNFGDNSVTIDDGGSITVGDGKVAIGKEVGSGTNNLLIIDNGTFTHTDAVEGIDVRRGTVRLSNGGAVSSASILLGADGRLEGSGTVTADVSGVAGGKVDVGQSPGVIDVVGNWNNTDLEILLEVDDVSSSPVAGVDYDLLDIVGQFTHGGSVLIDLSEYIPAPITDLKLIGWTTATGNAGDTSVSFTGGTAEYEIRTDGLYLIPEPATVGLMSIGLVVLCGVRRSRR